MPHLCTIQSCFGKLGTPGSIKECTQTVSAVFSQLEGDQLFCKILVDEIHIKPAIRYPANHLIGQSVDQPDKAARTVLCFMVASLMGGPAFIACIVPELLQLIPIIHRCNGFVCVIIYEQINHSSSQSTALPEVYERSASISNVTFFRTFGCHRSAEPITPCGSFNLYIGTGNGNVKPQGKFSFFPF